MEKDPHINQDLGNIFLEIERSQYMECITKMILVCKDLVLSLTA